MHRGQQGNTHVPSHSTQDTRKPQLHREHTVERAQELDVHQVDDNIDYRTQLQQKAGMGQLRAQPAACRQPSCTDPRALSCTPGKPCCVAMRWQLGHREGLRGVEKPWSCVAPPSRLLRPGECGRHRAAGRSTPAAAGCLQHTAVMWECSAEMLQLTMAF